jgi:predicted kinase
MSGAPNVAASNDAAAELQLRQQRHSRTVVVQMHGEPGSGKSTIAHALAPSIDAIVLDKDIIKSALLRSGAPEALAASGAYETYFDLARSFVDQGRSIILDNPLFWPRVEEQWLGVSSAAACPPLLIECICPDREELVRRLAARDGLESHPRAPLDLLRHPGSSETRFQPRITLDTTRPLDELMDQAIAYVDTAVRLPSPIVGEGLGVRP